MQAHLIRVSGKFLLDKECRHILYEYLGNFCLIKKMWAMWQGHLDKDLAWLDLNLFALGPPESAWNCHLYSSYFFTFTKKLCQNFPHHDNKYKDICKNKSLPHCRSLCPRCPFWRAKSNQSVSKDASFKQCWCELKNLLIRILDETPGLKELPT